VSTFEILSFFVSIILAAAAFYIAIMQYLHDKFIIKIKRFELDNRSIRNDYTKLCNRGIEIYKEIYNPLEEKQEVIVNSLIYKKDWISSEQRSLLTIDDIDITMSLLPFSPNQNQITKSEKLFRRKKIMPYAKKSLVDNIFLFLNHSHLWDNPTYIVDSITGGIKPELHIYISSYYNFYNSCMCFGYELAHFANNPTNNYKKSNRFRAVNELFDLSNRYCGIGTVAFTVFTNVNVKDQKKTFFVVQSRSEEVAEGKNIINAVPAGTYQPSVFSTKLEPLSLNIIREFGEEVQGRKEFTFAYSIEEIETNSISDELKKNIYFLGMGFNPLNTYLEILTLAIIDLSKPVNRLEFGSTLDDLYGKMRSNFEGTLEIEEFSRQKLTNLSATYHSAPSLKEIATILVTRLKEYNTDDVYRIL